MSECTIVKEKKINNIVNKYKCTNCMACYNVCPSNAIEIKEDDDGFAYPSIIEEKCTHCGLCKKKCSALNIEETKNITKRLDTPLAYGGYISDEEIRAKSASGGIFSLLANYILDKGGYVSGAMFTKGGILEHVIVNKKEDLDPIRASKYVQSNINYTYNNIKSLLDEDKYVLFCGTPCQVTGLYMVLGKDYDKLFTIDLLCHGLPSQKIFREYLNEITNGREEAITSIKFRDKVESWRNFYFSVEYDDKKISHSVSKDIYFQAFCNNLILRKSCTDCRYTSLPRKGDISIGDFWGVGCCDTSLDDNKGTSEIIVNSAKGEKILNELKNQFKIIKKISIEDAKKLNGASFSRARIHPSSAYFLNQYSKKNYKSISSLMEESLNKKDGIALLNFSESRCNYGCLLTAYALQYKIRQYGYSPVHIPLFDNYSLWDLNNLRDWQKDHIDYCAVYSSPIERKVLNNYMKTFIVGSDCVWLDFGSGMEFFNNYQFSFANFSKNICSYAASFSFKEAMKVVRGKGLFKFSAEEIKHLKRLYKRFSHIGVREKYGVDICKNTFDVEAEHVLDPVFFVPTEEWRRLSLEDNPNAYEYQENKSRRPLSYILNWANVPEEINKYVDGLDNIKKLYEGDSFGQVLADYRNKRAWGATVQEWINNIANCDIFYTDSFHGMCFAIMFNRPFILLNITNGYQRMESLLETLEMPSRQAHTLEDIKRLENEPIDWEKVNKNLKEKVNLSQAFLEKILYSHEHIDKVRGYMESLEILTEQRSKITPPQSGIQKMVQKEKWYFLGIHVFKKAVKNGNNWFYLFGIPLIKEEDRGYKKYYKLFGCLRLLKKTVK